MSWRYCSSTSASVTTCMPVTLATRDVAKPRPCVALLSFAVAAIRNLRVAVAGRCTALPWLLYATPCLAFAARYRTSPRPFFSLRFRHSSIRVIAVAMRGPSLPMLNMVSPCSSEAPPVFALPLRLKTLLHLATPNVALPLPRETRHSIAMPFHCYAHASLDSALPTRSSTMLCRCDACRGRA